MKKLRLNLLALILWLFLGNRAAEWSPSVKTLPPFLPIKVALYVQSKRNCTGVKIF